MRQIKNPHPAATGAGEFSNGSYAHFALQSRRRSSQTAKCSGCGARHHSGNFCSDCLRWLAARHHAEAAHQLLGGAP